MHVNVILICNLLSIFYVGKMKIVICFIFSLANCAPNWDIKQGSEDYAYTGTGSEDYVYTGTGSEDYAYTGTGSEDFAYTGTESEGYAYGRTGLKDYTSQDYGYTNGNMQTLLLAIQSYFLENCLAPGDLCLSFAYGALGQCCSGAGACNVFAGTGGYVCAYSDQGSEDYVYTGTGYEDYAYTGTGSEDSAYTGTGSEDYAYTGTGSEDYAYTGTGSMFG